MDGWCGGIKSRFFSRSARSPSDVGCSNSSGYRPIPGSQSGPAAHSQEGKCGVPTATWPSTTYPRSLGTLYLPVCLCVLCCVMGGPPLAGACHKAHMLLLIASTMPRPVRRCPSSWWPANATLGHPNVRPLVRRSPRPLPLTTRSIPLTEERAKCVASRAVAHCRP